MDHDGDRLWLWPLKVVLREVEAKVGEVLFNGRRSEEGEEAVGAIAGVMTGEVTKEKLGKLCSEGAVVRIAGAILDTP